MSKAQSQMFLDQIYGQNSEIFVIRKKKVSTEKRFRRKNTASERQSFLRQKKKKVSHAQRNTVCKTTTKH